MEIEFQKYFLLFKWHNFKFVHKFSVFTKFWFIFFSWQQWQFFNKYQCCQLDLHYLDKFAKYPKIVLKYQPSNPKLILLHEEEVLIKLFGAKAGNTDIGQFFFHSLVQHSRTISLTIMSFLKIHEVNQKATGQKDSFYTNIQVHWKTDTKNIRIGESLSEQTRPLFANFSNFVFTIWRKNFKFNVSTNAVGANWTFYG